MQDIVAYKHEGPMMAKLWRDQQQQVLQPCTQCEPCGAAFVLCSTLSPGKQGRKGEWPKRRKYPIAHWLTMLHNQQTRLVLRARRLFCFPFFPFPFLCIFPFLLLALLQLFLSF